MKRFFCMLPVLLCLTLTASAQIDTIWTAVLPEFGENYYDLTCGTAVPGGGFVLGGYYYQDNTAQDFLVTRIDGMGNIVWMNGYPESYTELPWDVLYAADGTIRVFGTQTVSSTETNIFMTTLSLNGDSLWTAFLETVEYYGSPGATQLSDGNFMIAMDTLAEDFSRNALLLKIDANGNFLWSRSFNYGEYTFGREVIESSDGTLLFAGDNINGAIGASNLFLNRLDSQGNILWSQTWPMQAFFSAEVTDLKENDAGDIFMTARIPDFWWSPQGIVLKYSAAGEPQWSGTSDSLSGGEFRGVAPLTDGGCIVAGNHLFDFTGFTSPVLYRYDSEGILTDIWQNEPQDWGFTGICPAVTGTFLAYGWMGVEFANHTGFLVSAGEPFALSGRVTHIEDDEPVEGVLVAVSEALYTLTDANGEYFLITTEDTVDISFSGPCINTVVVEDVILQYGETNTLDADVTIPEYAREPSSINLAIRYDIEITETVTIQNDGSGPLEFSADVTSTQPDYHWLSVEPVSGSVPAGQSSNLTLRIFADSQQSSEADYFGTVQIRNHSCPDSVDNLPVSAIALGVAESPSATATEYALHPAHPNPFNATTTLAFEIASPGIVFINLYDIQGRNTKAVMADYYSTGSHSLRLDMSDQSSGVYFIQMRCNDFTASQKLVLLK